MVHIPGWLKIGEPNESSSTSSDSIISVNTVMNNSPAKTDEDQIIKHSSINYCVVELESVSSALKKIDKLNSKLATRQSKSTALAKKRRKSSRAPVNNILNMGVGRLVTVPIKSMASYLAEESHVHNRVVDQFLFSWALGYRCASS